MANAYADFVHGTSKAVPGAAPAPAPASVPQPFNPATGNLADFVHHGSPTDHKITYFIADGTQKKEDGSIFKPGTVVVRAPQYVLDDATFKKSIVPLLSQPVQYGADGSVIHPILDKEVTTAIDAVGQNAKAVHDVTIQAKQNYGLDPIAADHYARNIVSALSADGKFTGPDGKPLYAGSVVSDFNKMNDSQKDAKLSELIKQSKNPLDPGSQGRALALLGVYQTKANVTARGGTVLKDLAGGAIHGLIDNLTFGKANVDPGASNPALLQHEAGATKIGDIAGNVAGLGATIGAAALTGGAAEGLAGASVARLFGAAANSADELAAAARFSRGALSVAQTGGKYVPSLVNDGQDLARLAEATSGVTDAGTAASKVGDALRAGEQLSPKVTRFLAENATFAGQQSLSEHVKRTGDFGFDNVAKNFAISAGGDAAFRGAIGGVKSLNSHLTQQAVESLGHDPIAPVKDYLSNLKTGLNQVVADKTHITKSKVSADETILPRANGIKSDTAFKGEYDAAKAISDAGYSGDETAEILSKVTPVKKLGSDSYDMEAVREAADQVDTKAIKTKTVSLVNDTTKLGTRTRQIFGRVFGGNQLARAKVAGILSNTLRLNADDSLHATQLYEAGKADEAEKFLLSKGVHPDAASLKELNDNVLQLARDAGIDTEELQNRLSRSRYGGKQADETGQVVKGGQGTSKQTAGFTKERLHGTAEDYVQAKGKIEDIGLANNAIGNLFEILDVARNKALYEHLSADGGLGFAPIRNKRNAVQLVKQKGVERYVSSADHWKSLGRVEITDKRILSSLGAKQNIFGAQTGIWVTPELKKVLSAQFKEDAATKLTKTVGGLAKFSKIIQDVHTSGGVPGTPLNSLVFVQSIIQAAVTPSQIPKMAKNLVTAISQKAYIADIASRDPKVLNGFANSDLGLFTDNIFGKAADKASVRAVNDSIEAGLETVKPGFSFSEAANNFDEAVAGATFRYLNLVQLDTYEHLYTKFVDRFSDEEKAAELAGEATKHFFGIKTTYDTASSRLVGERGPEFARNITTILISAPRYKQINIDRVLNTIRAFNPKTLLNSTERAKYALNYQLAGATLLITAGVEALDKAINGHFSTGNPIGTLDELQFPLGNGQIGRFSFTSQTTSTFRTGGRIVSDLVKDDPTKALDDFFSIAGYGVQPLLRLIANQKFGGNNIRNTDQSAGKQIVSALEYMGSTYTQHPYFRALSEYAKGQSWNAVTDALEAPINISNIRVIGQVDFNKKVVPDVQAIIDAHETDLNKAYNPDGTVNTPLQQKIMTDMYKDIRDRVQESAQKYGYDVKNLSDEMAGKLLSLIVGKEAISLSSGVSPEIGSSLDAGQQRSVTVNQGTVAREGAAGQGLDLYRYGDQLTDAQNKIYGAPKRIAAEFDQMTKATSSQPSLYDIKQQFDSKVDDLYKLAATQTGAAKTATYDQISKVQEAYMEQFDKRIQPLVAKYGTNVIANNGDVFKTLQSYIEVPNDLTPYASSKKQPYLVADVKQYLKDRYGVGPLNSQNIATDPEVLSAIKKANDQLASGKVQSAHFTLSQTQQKINQGKLFADNNTMERIAGQIKALNSSKGGGSSSGKSKSSGSAIYVPHKTPRFALRVGN